MLLIFSQGCLLDPLDIVFMLFFNGVRWDNLVRVFNTCVLEHHYDLTLVENSSELDWLPVFLLTLDPQVVLVDEMSQVVSGDDLF